MKKKKIVPNEAMRTVAEAIILLKIKDTDTLGGLKMRFYRIMRKYGIREGTRLKNQSGRSVANFEWTICKEAFYSRIMSHLIISSLLNPVPKDLEVY